MPANGRWDLILRLKVKQKTVQCKVNDGDEECTSLRNSGTYLLY
jgi:hypothetical protein